MWTKNSVPFVPNSLKFVVNFQMTSATSRLRLTPTPPNCKTFAVNCPRLSPLLLPQRFRRLCLLPFPACCRLPLVSPVLCVRPHNSSIDLAGFGCLLPRPVSVSMFRISLRGKVRDRSRRQEELQLARVNKLIGSRWSFSASLPSSRSSCVPRLANRWQWSLGVHHQQQIYPT